MAWSISSRSHCVASSILKLWRPDTSRLSWNKRACCIFCISSSMRRDSRLSVLAGCCSSVSSITFFFEFFLCCFLLLFLLFVRSRFRSDSFFLRLISARSSDDSESSLAGSSSSKSSSTSESWLILVVPSLSSSWSGSPWCLLSLALVMRFISLRYSGLPPKSASTSSSSIKSWIGLSISCAILSAAASLTRIWLISGEPLWSLPSHSRKLSLLM
mmetsp:Transcript_38794/g.61910  ORF Transcript_38794/g.61910 Transcript_38794/m.61910 type:complete len:215 (+) Transcript_38794:340-984(+)